MKYKKALRMKSEGFYFCSASSLVAYKCIQNKLKISFFCKPLKFRPWDYLPAVTFTHSIFNTFAIFCISSAWCPIPSAKWWVGPSMHQLRKNVRISGLNLAWVFVFPVGGMAPATDSPSATINLNFPSAFTPIESMVMGPSLILNSTPAPAPGLPWYFFNDLNTGLPSAIFRWWGPSCPTRTVPLLKSIG